MGVIVEILFGFLVEALLSILAEILIELGYGSIVDSFKRRSPSNRYSALLGCLLLGVLCGVGSLIIFPERIIGDNAMPGLSLVLSPVLAGWFMYHFGEIRRQKGKETSTLATFWGGAIFAFGTSTTRFIALM
jgi:hypothetical protein